MFNLKALVLVLFLSGLGLQSLISQNLEDFDLFDKPKPRTRGAKSRVKAQSRKNLQSSAFDLKGSSRENLMEETAKLKAQLESELKKLNVEADIKFKVTNLEEIEAKQSGNPSRDKKVKQNHRELLDTIASVLKDEDLAQLFDNNFESQEVSGASLKRQLNQELQKLMKGLDSKDLGEQVLEIVIEEFNV